LVVQATNSTLRLASERNTSTYSPLEPNSFDGEEVDGKYRRRMRPQEPGPVQLVTPRRWRHARRREHLPYRRRRDSDPELLEFAHDPLVAPI
jgi:hypothetical protein